MKGRMRGILAEAPGRLLLVLDFLALDRPHPVPPDLLEEFIPAPNVARVMANQQHRMTSPRLCRLCQSS